MNGELQRWRRKIHGEKDGWLDKRCSGWIVICIEERQGKTRVISGSPCAHVRPPREKAHDSPHRLGWVVVFHLDVIRFSVQCDVTNCAPGEMTKGIDRVKRCDRAYVVHA